MFEGKWTHCLLGKSGTEVEVVARVVDIGVAGTIPSWNYINNGDASASAGHDDNCTHSESRSY